MAYSTNAGASWPPRRHSRRRAALLLRSTDYIRFVPNGGTGASADFTYPHGDEPGGPAGTKVDSATIAEAMGLFHDERDRVDRGRLR